MNRRRCAVCGVLAASKDSVTVSFADTGQTATFGLCVEHAESATTGQLRRLAKVRRLARNQPRPDPVPPAEAKSWRDSRGDSVWTVPGGLPTLGKDR